MLLNLKMEVEIMATSSITHNFVIRSPLAARRFANAVDCSYKEAQNNIKETNPRIHFVRNTEEIQDVLNRLAEKINKEK